MALVVDKIPIQIVQESRLGIIRKARHQMSGSVCDICHEKLNRIGIDPFRVRGRVPATRRWEKRFSLSFVASGDQKMGARAEGWIRSVAVKPKNLIKNSTPPFDQLSVIQNMFPWIFDAAGEQILVL
jgi:hypothetical protein